MNFVAIKTPEQSDLLCLHRVRCCPPAQGYHEPDPRLPYRAGIIVRQGPGPLRKVLPEIFSSPPDALSPRILRLIVELDEDWRRLDQRLEPLSADIETLSENDPACQRLMTVPGIGPIISSAVVAAIGTGSGFKQGRDFAPGSASSRSRTSPRSHQAWQDLRARQQVPAHPLCPSRPCCHRAASRRSHSQVCPVPVDRPGFQAPCASQSARHCARQQARAHREDWDALAHRASFRNSARVGNSIWNVEPLPTIDSTQMRPPCISTICLAMASPRPVPPFALVRELSIWWNCSKMRFCSCSGMPGPVSATLTRK